MAYLATPIALTRAERASAGRSLSLVRIARTAFAGATARNDGGGTVIVDPHIPGEGQLWPRGDHTISAEAP